MPLVLGTFSLSLFGLVTYVMHELWDIILNIPYFLLTYSGKYRDHLIHPKHFPPLSEQIAQWKTEFFFRMRWWIPLMLLIGCSDDYRASFAFTQEDVLDGSAFTLPQSISEVASIAGLTWLIYILFQIGFYWGHKWLHNPWLYQRVHKYHHEYINTNFAGMGTHIHPFEIMVSVFLPTGFSFLVTSLFFGKIPFYSVLFGVFLMTLYHVEDHAGYKNLPWYVHGCHHHDRHHTTFNYNFGARWIDLLVGTDYLTVKGKTE